MPTRSDPDVQPRETCSRSGDVRLLKWMARSAIAVLALTAIEARAQDCRGVPARFAHAMVDRRVLSDGTVQLGGEAGIAANGRLGAYGNYSAVDIGLAGSRTLSYGGTVWRQAVGGRLAACLTGGYQQGRSYLINAAGTNENLRITQNSFAIGAAASMAFRPVPATRLIIYAFPSLILGTTKSTAYDRTTSTLIEDRPPPVAYVAGASLAVSRIFARAYWVKSGDSDPLIVLSGGLAW